MPVLSLRATPSKFAPVSVQTPVLNRLGNMIDLNIFFFSQIGDGAGDFQNSVVGAGGQTEFVYGRFKKIAGHIVDLAMFFNMATVHLGVAKYFCFLESFGLN